MALYLREGQRQAYVAEQTTRLLTGVVRESRTVVKHAGPGRERMEFLSPDGMRGEVILQVMGRLFHYKPRLNRIFEGVAPHAQFEQRGRAFMESVRAGRVGIEVTGSETVAGQQAVIVEIRAAAGSKRFWIDEKTGVRLRHEEVNGDGSVVQQSYFTKVDYDAAVDPKEFLPASLPNVPHEAVYPTGAPLDTVRAAQPGVPFPIREPALPEGYRLSGVWVVEAGAGRKVAVQRFTDGVRNFALFQQPAPARLPLRARQGRVNRRSGVAQWISGDQSFTLLGHLRPEASRRVIDSLR
jgi:outer membrane lipoprotein-sorting protein